MLTFSMQVCRVYCDPFRQTTRATYGKYFNKSLKKIPNYRNMTYTVAVEGNIGSGKTTLLQYFSRFPNVMTIQEPVEKWQNMKGYNLLDLMYRDPTRWSLTFQTYVQLTMVNHHLKQSNEEIKLMERSIYSARHCFVETLFQSGFMPEVEYRVLCEWYNWLLCNEDLNIDLIVYLRTKPETVYKRIQQRCRKEEINISLDYLKALHDIHEKWLMSKNNSIVPAPVLVLNVDCELNDMHTIFKKHTSDILFQEKPCSKSDKVTIP